MSKTDLAILDSAREKFEVACKSAKSLQVLNNFGAAFTAVSIVKTLREILTDEIMNEVFMPLMNTKVGFLTDKPGKDKQGNPTPTYPISVVRDCIIEGVSIGLMPTGNQMNILAGKMYPTKEGYTSLLKDINCKYFLDVSFDKGSNANFAEIPVKVSYEHNGDKNGFTVTATVKKDSYSSHDALRGKAERSAKKKLYEYLTGFDLGEGDPDTTIETSATVLKSKLNISEEEKELQRLKDHLLTILSEEELDDLESSFPMLLPEQKALIDEKRNAIKAKSKTK